MFPHLLQPHQPLLPGGDQGGVGPGQDAPEHGGPVGGGRAPVRHHLQGQREVREQARQERPSLPPHRDSQRANQADRGDQGQGGGRGLQPDAGHHHRGDGEPDHHGGDGGDRSVHHQMSHQAEN